jgi:hypothetical protein
MSAYLDNFLAAYIECALWSSTDNADESGGAPLDDNYGPEDIDPESLAKMRAECADFIERTRLDERDTWWTAEQAGHDFWLTRNGHGAGFWDRGQGRLGDALARIAKEWSGRDLYVHDGKVYQS